MLSYALLGGAILAEVAATLSLKMSDGFTRLWPSAVVVVGYIVSFMLLAHLLTRGMSLGVVYAVWSAVGVALIVIAGVILFDERLTIVQMAGVVCVVVGVAALELGGASS
jgi:small multidrug resistance pump